VSPRALISILVHAVLLLLGDVNVGVVLAVNRVNFEAGGCPRPEVLTVRKELFRGCPELRKRRADCQRRSIAEESV